MAKKVKRNRSLLAGRLSFSPVQAAAVVVVALLAGFIAYEFLASHAGRPVAKLSPASGAYWGMYTNYSGGISGRESQLGRKLNVHQMYYSWTDSWPTSVQSDDYNNGRIPLVTWEPWNTTLADIANGTYDSNIISHAQAVKNFGHPIFLRFMHEMNGNWYPWDGYHNGSNSTATSTYIAAFRHVHDLFVQYGATNAVWIWCPNVNDVPSQTWNHWTNYYPGDAYVDWVGIDGYNWGSNQGGWKSFASIFGGSGGIYANYAGSKPIMIAETASVETAQGAPSGTTKGQWIKDMESSLSTQFPAIEAVLWFDKVGSTNNWAIDTSTDSMNGYTTAGHQSYVSQPINWSLTAGSPSATPTPTPSSTPTPSPSPSASATPSPSPSPSQSPSPSPSQSASASPSPSGNTVTVNDSVAGTGLGQFNYVGSGWNYSYGDTSKYDNDDHWDYNTNDYFTFSFKGTQVSYYATQDSRSGDAAISVDGGPETIVSEYGSKVYQKNFYTSPVLPDGTHTLKVRVNGTGAYGHTIGSDKVMYVASTAVTATGSPSPIVSASATPAPTPVPDTTPPTAPGNLQASAVSSVQVNLSWGASTDNVGVSGYHIYRATSGSSAILLANANAGATSYSDTTVSGSTNYSYYVRAFDAAGNVSASSNTVNVSTPAPADTAPPTAPANVSATPVSQTQINVAWSPSSDNVGVAGYYVYRGQAVVAQTASTSFSDTGLSAGTTYSYYVRAYDAAGNLSPASATVSATTAQPAGDTTPPTAPANLVSTYSSKWQINLQWSASTDNVGVAGYYIYRNGSYVGSTSGTSYGDGTVKPNQYYSYTVRAYDAAGNVSANSAAINVRAR